jgi:hypothetical protein
VPPGIDIDVQFATEDGLYRLSLIAKDIGV